MTNHNSQVSRIVSFRLRTKVAVPSSNDCLPNESRLETAAKSKLREVWELWGGVGGVRVVGGVGRGESEEERMGKILSVIVHTGKIWIWKREEGNVKRE